MKKQNTALFIIVFIGAFILIKLILPFILYNNLNIQDMVGHLFSAYYTKEFLFPDIIGWNPFFYLGMPQNQLYPPLFTLLTVFLSFIFGVELAFKLIFSIAIAVTPLSFYYLARKFGFDKFKAAISMLLMASALFAIDYAIGGNFPSSFKAGMVGNALAIPLLFFYLGSLHCSLKDKKIAKPSIFMALLVLSNIFVAAAGIIVSLSFIAFNLSKRNTLFFLKHGILSFLLAGFWIFPVLFKAGYSRVTYLAPMEYFNSIAAALMALLFFYSSYILIKTKNKKFYYIIASICLLSIIELSGFFLSIPFQFYRFDFVIIILILLLAANSLQNSKSLVLVGMLSLLIIFSNSDSLHPEGIEDTQIKNVGKLDGRTLVIYGKNFDFGYHTFPHKFAMETGNHVIKGSFIESSRNAIILNDIVKLIDNDSWFPYEYMHPIYANLSNPKLKRQIPNYLNFFNINYIISKENKVHGELIEKNVIVFRNLSYNLYKVGNSSLIEVLNYKPIAAKEEWDKQVGKWFFSGRSNKILVNEEVPSYIGTGNEKIEMISATKNYDRLIFNVDSKNPVPILIKISYFPNWKAYSNGKEIKIYKASPYLMLVYGKGEIELKYKKLLVDYIGYALTLIGVIALSARAFYENKILKP